MMYADIVRVMQPDNVWMWVIGACLLLLSLAWFMVKLFIGLFFGGRLLRKIASTHKKFDSNDALPVAEPKIGGF